MAVSRKKLKDTVVTDLFADCRRVCAMCYALANDATPKYGQIAHLDHDRTNDDPDNLAYLCLAHHDEYDTTRRLTRGFTPGEIKRYRALLVQAVKDGLAPKAHVHRTASLRMRLRDAFFDHRTTSYGSQPARDLVFILVTVSNSGDIATCIEDVTLYWNGRPVAGEREGLAFFKSEDGKSPKATWWRKEAVYLECDSTQVIEPGRVGQFVAPMLFHLPDGFPSIESLRRGKREIIALDPPLILELVPVVGAPIAVEVPYLKGESISARS